MASPTLVSPGAVSWQRFPYHGGFNFEGPAPRPLERFAVSVAEDGQIAVDESMHFQKELGQWADAHSYIRLRTASHLGLNSN